MENKEWLKDIKVGDKVICQNRWVTYIRDVEKANKSELKIEGDRFSRKTGNNLSRLDWEERLIAIATPEDKKKLEAVNVINSVALQRVGGFTVDELNQILKIFNESAG